jgi:hypothetical protein
MPDRSQTDEELKDRAIEQALTGNIIGARQTVGGIVDRGYLGEAWKAILFIQTDRGDVHGVKCMALLASALPFQVVQRRGRRSCGQNLAPGYSALSTA